MQNTTDDAKTDDEKLLEARAWHLKSLPPEAKREFRTEWLALFREIGETLADDPASPKAQELASRWMDLVGRMMGGDPYLMQDPAVYVDLSRWPNSMSMFTDRRVWDFIAKSLAARETGLGR